MSAILGLIAHALYSRSLLRSLSVVNNFVLRLQESVLLQPAVRLLLNIGVTLP